MMINKMLPTCNVPFSSIQYDLKAKIYVCSKYYEWKGSLAANPYCQ